MHPNTHNPEKTKSQQEVDTELVFSELSSKFGHLSSQLKKENEKGKYLSWHIDYQSENNSTDLSSFRHFNMEFRNKSKCVMDIKVSIDPAGRVKVEGGTIEPDLLDEGSAESIQGLTSTPAFKKYFTATQIFARDGYYRLKSIISVSQLSKSTLYEYLDDIVEQMGLFLDLLLDRIKILPALS
jgi:hypothetical protein